MKIERIYTIDEHLLGELYQLEKICFGTSFPTFTFGPKYEEYYIKTFPMSVQNKGDILLVANNDEQKLVGVLLLELYDNEEVKDFMHDANDKVLKYQKPFWYMDSMFIEPKQRRRRLFYNLLESFANILLNDSSLYGSTDVIRFHAQMDDPIYSTNSMAAMVSANVGFPPLRIVYNYYNTKSRFAYFEIPVNEFTRNSKLWDTRKFEKILVKSSNWINKYRAIFNPTPVEDADSRIRHLVQSAQGHMYIGSFVLAESLSPIYENTLYFSKYEHIACELHPYRLRVLSFDKATKEAEAALLRYCSSTNIILKALSFLNMGVVATREMNISKAIYWYQRAYREAAQTENKVLKARCVIALGSTYLSERNYISAFDCACEAIELIEQVIEIQGIVCARRRRNLKNTEITFTLGMAHLLLAQVQARIDDIQNAEHNLIKAIKYMDDCPGIFWDIAMRPIVSCYFQMEQFQDDLLTFIDKNYNSVLQMAIEVASQAGHLPPAVNEWIGRHRLQTSEFKAQFHLNSHHFSDVCETVRILFQKTNSGNVDKEAIGFFLKIDRATFTDVCKHFCEALNSLYVNSTCNTIKDDINIFEDLLKNPNWDASRVSEELEKLLEKSHKTNVAGFNLNKLSVTVNSTGNYSFKYNSNEEIPIEDTAFHILMCLYINREFGFSTAEISAYLHVKKAGIAANSIRQQIRRFKKKCHNNEVIKTIGGGRYAKYKLMG